MCKPFLSKLRNPSLTKLGTDPFSISIHTHSRLNMGKRYSHNKKLDSSGIRETNEEDEDESSNQSKAHAKLYVFGLASKIEFEAFFSILICMF